MVCLLCLNGGTLTSSSLQEWERTCGNWTVMDLTGTYRALSANHSVLVYNGDVDAQVCTNHLAICISPHTPS
jgi:hypothetical protein